MAATAPSAIAKTRSLAPATIGCMPVKAPNAGSTPTVVAEPEARQAQVVEGAAAEADARMQVAGEHVGAAARPRMVAEGEAVELERLVDDPHAQVRRRIAGAVVVVAAHEDELERRVLARQRATAPSVAGACERAECRKSPRKTTRRARRSAISADSAASVSLVVPRGTGTPRARNSPPCRCGRRRRAGCGWRRGRRPSRRAASGGRPAARIVVVTGARLRRLRPRTGAARRRGARSGSCLNPERAKRCRRPIANAVSADACACASTVGVCEPAPSASWRRLWRSCDSMRSKNWFMRVVQALVLEHQRVADHHPRHARVLLAELEQHREDLVRPARARRSRARRSG